MPGAAATAQLATRNGCDPGSAGRTAKVIDLGSNTEATY